VVSAWEQFRASFDRLETELVARKKAAEAETTMATRFNIFDLLRVARLEMYHTRLLGELLRSNGSHGQGRLFLDIFADIVCAPPLRTSLRAAKEIVTSVEYNTYFGRLDILISSGRRFLIIIENKIGATDAPDQIERYGKWLARNTNVMPDCRLLLYLTPEGSRSIYKTDGYIPISYKKHIYNLLQTAITQGLPAKLASLIEQYSETIALM
jgi:hypothetical protein